MSIYHFMVPAAALWLSAMAACVLALWWSRFSLHRRFWPSVILSVVALGISGVGLRQIHFACSQTVNGRLQWRLDSNWFFMASLLLSALALAYTLWKARKSAGTA